MAAMPKSINIDVEYQGADKVKTLIELLHSHRESLPSDLVKSLDELADCKSCEYDSDNIRHLGFTQGDCICFCDGKKIDNIKSINIILKRVLFYNEDRITVGSIYPGSFSISNSKGKEKVFW